MRNHSNENTLTKILFKAWKSSMMYVSSTGLTQPDSRSVLKIGGEHTVEVFQIFILHFELRLMQVFYDKPVNTSIGAVPMAQKNADVTCSLPELDSIDSVNGNPENLLAQTLNISHRWLIL